MKLDERLEVDPTSAHCETGAENLCGETTTHELYKEADNGNEKTHIHQLPPDRHADTHSTEPDRADGSARYDDELKRIQDLIHNKRLDYESKIHLLETQLLKLENQMRRRGERKRTRNWLKPGARMIMPMISATLMTSAHPALKQFPH